jgi:hypothetical protein
MNPTRLLLTGARQRENARRLQEYHRYQEALLVELDLDSGETRTLLSWTPEPDAALDHLPNALFKSATLEGDRLYLCTETEVLVRTWPGVEPVARFSLPCFNDVHHVLPDGDHLHVVSTGLDLVVTLDASGAVVDLHNVLGEDPWARFDPEVDYRKVPSTKPHHSHPNFAFHRDGRLWVTRFKQRDAVPVHGGEGHMRIGLEGIHDGLPEADGTWFTVVDGRVVRVSPETGEVDRILDLNATLAAEGPLGWCRGLHLSEERAYVGFSRLRNTRVKENLRWLARLGGRGVPRPCRVEVVRREDGAPIRTYDLEEAGLSSVFSVIGLP